LITALAEDLIAIAIHQVNGAPVTALERAASERVPPLLRVVGGSQDR
jgi:hypothetical protein